MIISDSTAIITLINIGEFKVLKLFIDKLILAKEVYQEVSFDDNAKIFLEAEIEATFIEVYAYKNSTLFEEINLILDKGESASLTLAIENQLPLIIDEKKGRNIAKNIGIEIVGLVGMIHFLYLENKIDKKQTLKLVDKLNSSDFRISNKLLKMILKK